MDLRLIILLGIVLLIYVLTNYYILHIALYAYRHGAKYSSVIAIDNGAYPVGRILQAFISPGITIKIIIAAGSYYLASWPMPFSSSIYGYLQAFIFIFFLPLLGTTLQAQIWKVGICLIIVLISFGSLNPEKLESSPLP